jgi:[ribosomal protein S18]-alanine N-acetyltransferase
MNKGDIQQVRSLENISFPKPWKEAAFLSELDSPMAINQVLKYVGGENDQKLIAYACSQLVIDELSLLRIAVAPDCQLKGVGTYLLNQHINRAIKDGAEKIFLEVRPSNHSAIAFYKKSGFQIIGKRLNYYSETGEDALVMTKNLKENRDEH